MEQNYSDYKTIIEAIRQRKPDVFVYLKKKCFGPVKMLVTENSGSDQDAEDIYNDGLAALMQLIDSTQQEFKCKVTTLTITLCRKIWLKTLRKKKLAEKYISEDQKMESFDQRIEEEMDNNIFKNILYQSFSKLKEDCQRILRNFFDGMRLNDLAHLLGVSPGYLKKRKHYCYKYYIDCIKCHPEAISINNSKY